MISNKKENIPLLPHMCKIRYQLIKVICIKLKPHFFFFGHPAFQTSKINEEYLLKQVKNIVRFLETKTIGIVSERVLPSQLSVVVK